jgi:hypothetical protein
MVSLGANGGFEFIGVYLEVVETTELDGSSSGAWTSGRAGSRPSMTMMIERNSE